MYYGMLTGAEIEKQIRKGNILIDPFDESRLNPNSYNLRLHPQILTYSNQDELDMMKDNPTKSTIIQPSGFKLMPGVLYIGRTIERTATDKFIPMLDGRSSGGRLGISIHICAGFGDVGFDGTWTLEISVIHPVIVYPNCEIAQICFFTPCGSIGMLYNGKYQNQEKATPSRFFKDI